MERKLLSKMLSGCGLMLSRLDIAAAFPSGVGIRGVFELLDFHSGSARECGARSDAQRSSMARPHSIGPSSSAVRLSRVVRPLARCGRWLSTCFVMLATRQHRSDDLVVAMGKASVGLYSLVSVLLEGPSSWLTDPKESACE